MGTINFVCDKCHGNWSSDKQLAGSRHKNCNNSPKGRLDVKRYSQSVRPARPAQVATIRIDRNYKS